MINASFAAPLPHLCQLPEILRFEYAEDGDSPPKLFIDHRPGTRFICTACDRTYTCKWVEGYTTGTAQVMGGYEWVPESRRERRERLGIPWWRFWKSTRG